jgi:hypothetical protein
MLTFKESIELINANEDEFESMIEALNMQQRMAAKRAFKKNKHKIERGRKKAEKRTASADVLAKRARKQARNNMLKKMTKDVGKDELSFAKRQEIEKRLDKKKSVIDRMAKKLIPHVRKAERERKRSKQAK